MSTAEMPNETFDWEAAAASLNKRADEGFPAAWQPEQPDEQIIGWVRRVTMQAPTSYGPSPVVELETQEGNRVSVWLYHTVIRRMFERERVLLGELVLIRYLGKKTREVGNPYDDYRLVVHRPGAGGDAPDWAAIADAYGDAVDDAPRGRGDAAGMPLDATPEDDDIPF